MNFISLLLISIGLATDAFAISITKGLTMKRLEIKHTLRIAIIFGLFQVIIPFIGWNIGSLFTDKVSQHDYLVTSLLLFLVGSKMLFDTWKGQKCQNIDQHKVNSNLLILGLATSIDALAIGFSFSLIPDINIFSAIGIIGIITFFISSIGMYLGYRASHLISHKVEYIGGSILILMGFKAFVENFF